MYISVKQTIKEFKKCMAKQAGMPIAKMRLFYGDQELMENGCGWEELRGGHARMLHTLRLQDGDEFLIEKTFAE